MYLKYFLYLVFTGGVIFGFIFVNDQSPLVFKLLFTVSISGLIGIGTNTIAIRMLFRPLEKTRLLKRQGLLPKNKDRIANTIAKAVRDRILNEETISDWLENEDEIEERVNNLVSIARDWLKISENQIKIKNFIKKIYDSSEKSEIFNKVYDYFVELLVEVYESKALRFSEIYSKLREKLREEKNKNNPLVLKSIELTKKIIKEFVKRNASVISDKINEIIDDYINKQKGLKGIFLGLGRVIFIDEKKVREFVVTTIDDPERLNKFGNLMEDMLPYLDEVLRDDEIREELKNLFEEVKYKLYVYLKENKLKEIVFKIENRIDMILKDDDEFNRLFERIHDLIIKLIERGIELVRNKIKDGKIIEFLKEIKLGEKIENIVRDNILKQDLKEFEQLMKRIMGENLAFIEILGGFLGLLIGVGIHFKIFLLIIPLVIFVIISIDNLVTKIFNAK